MRLAIYLLLLLVLPVSMRAGDASDAIREIVNRPDWVGANGLRFEALWDKPYDPHRDSSHMIASIAFPSGVITAGLAAPVIEDTACCEGRVDFECHCPDGHKIRLLTDWVQHGDMMSQGSWWGCEHDTGWFRPPDTTWLPCECDSERFYWTVDTTFRYNPSYAKLRARDSTAHIYPGDIDTTIHRKVQLWLRPEEVETLMELLHPPILEVIRDL